jgi:V-type H+-transporting ATPase S1 subunit
MFVQSQTDSDTLTVVFVERQLSVENLSQCKLKSETCFKNLRNIEQKTYLSAVEDPVKALQESFSDNSQKSISLSNEGDLEKFDASGNEKVLFVHFDSVESDEDYAKHGKWINFSLFQLVVIT